MLSTVLMVGVMLLWCANANPTNRQNLARGIPISIKTVEDLEKRPDLRDWIVIQYREDVKQSTAKFKGAKWADYKVGFGDTNGDLYWAGLEKLHQITNKPNTKWELLTRYELEDSNKGGGEIIYYDDFKVADELFWYQVQFGNYRIHEGSQRSIDRSIKQLTYSDGMFFSTRDRDVDAHATHDCAESREGGWWFRGCGSLCPNCKESHNYPGIKVKSTMMAIRNISAK